MLVIAVPFGVLAARAWRGDARAGATSMVAGVVTVGWIVVQLAFIREFSVFQPVYAAVGVAFFLTGRRLRAGVDPDVDTAAVARFLEVRRVALVGASDDPRNFSSTVLRELVDHGYDVVPVNPNRADVGGVPCVATVGDVPGDLDAVMVMLTGTAAMEAVRASVDRGVTKVWLFRGAGGPGAFSVDAVAWCRAHGVDVVAGACPLMFLEPVAGVHRAHLAVRRFAGAID